MSGKAGSNQPGSLQSGRLTLVASTPGHLKTELEHPERLTQLLDAEVSSDWPSGEYDRGAMEFFLARLEEGGESAQGWYAWYALACGADRARRTLVGAGGYFGPPDEAGLVEVGYSVLPEWQRQGYATEIVGLLARHAFTFAEVNRIIAHTTAENPASIGVLVRCGFVAAGPGADPSTLRFELHRSARS